MTGALGNSESAPPKQPSRSLHVDELVPSHRNKKQFLRRCCRTSWGRNGAEAEAKEETF